MPNQRWRFLQRALEDLSASAHSVGLDSILVDRIEAAAAHSDKARLEDASQELIQFLSKVYNLLPEDAKLTLRDGAGDRTLLLAHAVGQVGFAQLFASQIAERRAPNEVEQALSNARFVPFLSALYRGERSGRQLADDIGQTPENVSRILAELRTLGLVDFRRQGQSQVNFLTPMARAAYAPEGEAERGRRLQSMTPGKVRLEEIRQQAPDHMRTIPDLAPPAQLQLQ